jgi:hypothetical protein
MNIWPDLEQKTLKSDTFKVFKKNKPVPKNSGPWNHSKILTNKVVIRLQTCPNLCPTLEPSYLGVLKSDTLKLFNENPAENRVLDLYTSNTDPYPDPDPPKWPSRIRIQGKHPSEYGSGSGSSRYFWSIRWKLPSFDLKIMLKGRLDPDPANEYGSNTDPKSWFQRIMVIWVSLCWWRHA